MGAAKSALAALLGANTMRSGGILFQRPAHHENIWPEGMSDKILKPIDEHARPALFDIFVNGDESEYRWPI